MRAPPAGEAGGGGLVNATTDANGDASDERDKSG
jgi:hypothetical protein